MASSEEFVQYVIGQLDEAGNIIYKKLFGEYGLWYEGKFFGTVEDNQFYVKMTKAGKQMLPEAEPVAPHGGRPGMYAVENLEDRAFLAELVRVTCNELPARGRKERPKRKPTIIDVPEMIFIMVDGRGNPNTSESYKNAMEILYGLSFTIKMSKMSKTQPEGYFDYVVSPLEGLWWVEDKAFDGLNVTDKDKFFWTSMIRQPEFVTESVFEWAKASLQKKKPYIDFSSTRLVRFTEGLCCQAMHVGPYDAESETIKKMEAYIEENGYILDINSERRHHEIYLGDPRRAKPENLKTVIRHPVRKK